MRSWFSVTFLLAANVCVSFAIITNNNNHNNDDDDDYRISEKQEAQESVDRGYGSYHHHGHHDDHHGYQFEDSDFGGYQSSGGHLGGGGFGHGALGLKGLLVPLAGVALLGAAAAFISNPILLQLGVVTGKRRRRDTNNDVDPIMQQRLQEIGLLEKFMANLPQEHQQEKILASYLSCSGLTSDNNTCLERLTCELNHPKSTASQLDRDVMTIVSYNIQANEFVPGTVKRRLQMAARFGQQSGECSAYLCSAL